MSAIQSKRVMCPACHEPAFQVDAGGDGLFTLEVTCPRCASGVEISVNGSGVSSCLVRDRANPQPAEGGTFECYCEKYTFRLVRPDEEGPGSIIGCPYCKRTYSIWGTGHGFDLVDGSAGVTIRSYPETDD